MDLPPLDRSNQRERLETATDEQVFERFKKRWVRLHRIDFG